MNYIEKDKAYKIVLHHGSYAASAKIADLPSIDLVRCGECKRHSTCTRYRQTKNDDWFCADGERSEE
jgi:hypothetical protein